MQAKPTYEELEYEVECLREKINTSDKQIKFDSFFENNKAAMLQIDVTTKQIINANIIAVDFYGYSKTELLQKTIYNLHTLQPSEVNSFMKEALKRVSNCFEFTHKIANGEIKNVQVYASPSKSADDTQMIITIHDITERYQVEKEMKMLASSIASINECVSITDSNNIILFLNDAFLNTYGYTKDELIGKNISIVRPKDEVGINSVENILQETLNGNWQGEIINQRKDGSLFPIHLSTSIIKDDDGNALSLIGITTDITERKQAEELLRISESRFRMIHENAPILIDGFDKNGRCILWNKSCEQTFGWSIEEINSISDPLSLFYPDPEMRQQVLNSISQNPDNEFREWIANSKTGDKITCMWSNYDLPDGTIMSVGYDITEHKKTENALKLSEQRYRLLAENANDIIWTMNLEGRFTYVSPSVEKLRGYTVAEVMKQQIYETLTPNSLEVAVELFSDAIKSIKSGTKFTERLIEFEQPCKDGSSIWTEATMSIIYDTEGEFVSFLGITRDISERKRNEQIQNILLNIANAVFITHNISELIGIIRNELSVLIDTTNLFVAMYHKSTNSFTLPYHEDEFDKVSSFPADKTITRYVVETGKSLLADLDTLKELEKASKIETFGKDSLSWLGVPLNDGKRVMGAIVIQSYTDENAFNETDKDLLEIISVHISLAINRKKAELKLQESEFRFKALHNATFGGIIIHDQGLILDCNQGLANITGYTVDELIGIDGFLLIAEQSHEIVMKNILSAYEKPYEAVGLRKNGNEYALRLESRNIPYKGKQVRTTEFRDISEQKSAELEIIKAKDKAEESDRLKSAFLANMSHEIRTPMNGILGFASLLKEPGLTGEQQQEYIKIIEKGGVRMLNIINNIVNISKIESGQMEVSIQETNINEQIEYIYSFFKPEIEKKGIQFLLNNSLPLSEAIIKTDREKIYAILTNLVKNAIKYTENGSIEIGYYIKNDKEFTELEFYVKDTGIGIPKDRQKAIFERFIQADIEDKMAHQGAGLGLSISRAYAEIIGGKICLESEEGKGSTFYFTLPYKTDVLRDNFHEDNKLTSIDKTSANKFKILIVEDDEASEMLLSISIEKIAKEIITVRTGIEAVQACRNNPDIDFVLMDIQLPKMNGYEATQEIRKFNKEVIIIAQTAYGLSGEKDKGIAAGCNYYLPKPIDITELKRIINLL